MSVQTTDNLPVTSDGKSHSPSESNGHGQHANGQHEHGAEGEIPHDLPQVSNGTVLMVVCGFVVLLIAMFLIGYIPHHRAEKAAEAQADERAHAEPTVGVVHPKESPTLTDVVLPCDVRAFAATDLYPRANGFLKKWYVDIQAHVEAGQLLAEIDAPDLDAQLAQGKATLEQNKSGVIKAQADLKLAEVTLKRYQDAQKTSPGSVTQEDLDAKQSGYDTAKAALTQSESNVKASEASVQNLAVSQGFTKIIAPFAGTITARNYDAGALLNPSLNGPGKQIFSIADTDTLRVFISVPQTYATDMKTSQPAFLRVTNFQNREFKGTVARTSGAIDPNTRTLGVEVDIPNKSGELYAGMYGQIRLPVTHPTPVMTIPTSALVFNAQGLQVATVSPEGKVHIQKVSVGRDLGTEIEITAGLALNDQIVVNPGEKAGEGATVNVEDASKGQPQGPTEKHETVDRTRTAAVK